MADPSAARDRTVHARYTGMEIVRYDRSGKWYLEPTDARLKRQHVKIKDAVAAARWGIANANGSVTFGLRGGNSFERMVQGADPTPSAATRLLKAGDLRNRALALSRACSDRGMGKSHAMHVAARLLTAAAEVIDLAEEIDGTDDAAEHRRVRDEWLRERNEAERLRERVSELERFGSRA